MYYKVRESIKYYILYFYLYIIFYYLFLLMFCVDCIYVYVVNFFEFCLL